MSGLAMEPLERIRIAAYAGAGDGQLQLTEVFRQPANEQIPPPETRVGLPPGGSGVTSSAESSVSATVAWIARPTKFGSTFRYNQVSVPGSILSSRVVVPDTVTLLSRFSESHPEFQTLPSANTPVAAILSLHTAMPGGTPVTRMGTSTADGSPNHANRGSGALSPPRCAS